MIKSIWKKRMDGYGLNDVLLSLYCSFVLSSVLMVQLAAKLGNRLAAPAWLLLLLAFFLLCSLISRSVFKKLAGLTIRPEPIKRSRREELTWFGGFFLLSFLSLALWYLVYYPGWFTGDSEWQLTQAISGEYNDWHPVLQTILTFTIPLTICHGWKGSIILFQILAFSLALSYLCLAFLRYGNKKFALGALIFVAWNPLTGAIIKQPWKDVTFAIFAILLLGMALRIIFDPEWAKKWWHLLLFGIFLAMGTIVRHNAILFTLPLALAILLSLRNRKNSLIFLGSAILVFALIKGPVYQALNVADPGSRPVETLGLPMSVIGNVVKNDPSSLDEETLSFAYQIASPEDWETYYNTGDFNSLKFTDGCNTQPINDAGTAAVLGMMLRCFQRSPAYAIEGLLSTIYMVFTISGPINWTPEFIPPVIYSLLNNSLLRYLSLYIGIPTLICILFTLSKCRFNRKKDWSKLLICLSLLIHNWGTMLLLTGPDFRFFYLTWPVSTAIVFLMLHPDQQVLVE